MSNKDDIFQNDISFKSIYQKLLSFRKYYIYTILIFLFIAFLINKYSVPKYKNTSIVFISNDNNQSNFLAPQQGMQAGISLFGNTKIMDNETEILTSFSLLKKSVNSMDVKASYYAFNNSFLANLFQDTPFTRKRELYDESPIKVVIDQSFPQAVYLKMTVKFLNENQFYIEAVGTDIYLYNYIDDNVVSYGNDIPFKGKFNFGDEVKTRYFNFRIIKSDQFDVNFTKNRNLFFFLNDMNNLTMEFQGSIVAKPTSLNSTLIELSLKGTHPTKITDFLNTLTSLYMERSLEKKNSTALNTVDFIDSQISEIADSLSSAEVQLRNFRSVNQVMDLSYQGQQSFQKLNELESERAKLIAQKQYYAYLKNYLDNNSSVSDLSAPSSMNVIDPILTNLITQMITYDAEKASLLKNNPNTQNIYLADLNLKIDQLKRTIRENVTNTLNTINMTINETNYRISSLSSNISQMPKTELQLRGIERNFKLNDAIYTFLLQKRSEAQIARASSKPDSEIIDAARTVASRAISPNSTINYIIALFLGLFLPTSVIFIKDFLNNKMSFPEEVENSVNIPILGKIFRNYRKTNLVVSQRPNSSVTESFRAVRTNFQFFAGSGDKQVLLLTSTTSGEGKTFCSINLASAFALNGHKTVILEFDLRRPKIHQDFGSSNMIGISSYLIDKAIVDDIIMPTQIENLDLISAGPAAPNPAELIASEKTNELILKLKEMYDYIIIDSAPAGILTETHLLMKHADINIFVVRMDYTIKDAFKNTLKTLLTNKFSNLAILINDVNVKRDAYKYGYNSKYYIDDRKQGIIARMFNGKKRAS